MESLLADKLRALLYVRKFARDGKVCCDSEYPSKGKVEQDFEEALRLKRELGKYSYEQMMEVSGQANDDYDWTIGYSLTSTSFIDKKAYISSLLNVNYLLVNLEIRTCRLS